MAEEQITEAQLREAAVETTEARGVEELESTTWLEAEQEDQLDAKTAEELDDEGTRALEEGTSEAEGAEDEAMARGRSSHRLSRNFRLAEFHCKDPDPTPAESPHVPGQAVPALRRLCRDVLQPLRDEFGVATVNSGHRTHHWNRVNGGASRSQHIYTITPDSVAADVRFARGNPSQWYAFADRLLGSRGGLGRYRTFIHCDNRRTRWRDYWA